MGFPTSLHVPHFLCLKNQEPTLSLFTTTHKGQLKRSVRVTCLDPMNQDKCMLMKKRALLLLGISALPFLESSARAIEATVTEKLETCTAEVSVFDQPENRGEIPVLQENGTGEKIEQRLASGNAFVGLLNDVGIVGSGILGALYALAQKEKKTTESTIEALRAKVRDKEWALTTMEKQVERRLLEEQERSNQKIREVKEEQLSLSNKLALANQTVADLRRDLGRERNSIQDLQLQVESLQINTAQARREKGMLESKLEEAQNKISDLQDRTQLLSAELQDKNKNINNLNMSMVRKESELKDLSLTYEETRTFLAKLNSEILGLKNQLSVSKKELDTKTSSIEALNQSLKMATAERDDLKNKISNLDHEYKKFKSSSEEKIAADSKLISQKEDEILELREQLEQATRQSAKYHGLVDELTAERDGLNAGLEREIDTVKSLRSELLTTQETLESSKLETESVRSELEKSTKALEMLYSDVSKFRTEFSEDRKVLQKSLEGEKLAFKALSEELVALRKTQKKTQEELLTTTEKLKSSTKTSDKVCKELLEAQKSTEAAINDVREERKIVKSLNRELEISKKQVLEALEARKALEKSLNEAGESLVAINENVLSLSKELEASAARNDSLESEKDLVYKSLIEQKKVAKEAQENAEDAHNMLLRIGKERETLSKRAKKLEEEMASAKGEILRLRRQLVDGQHQLKSSEKEGVGPTTSKKTVRRRKAGPTLEVS
ncbi:hypothetical protein AMTRI_Chr05g73370 [Amborella trichopoda]